MRAIGFILILFGALALGVEGFAGALGVVPPVRVYPLASGIALVFGLLVLTTTGQRDDEDS